jgi:Rad3-related DNA helicase
MPEPLCLSVRELVEFSFHGENLTRGMSVRSMLEGAISHRARQKALGEGWAVEAPIALSLDFLDDDTLLLTGRMDGFREGDTPEIEEIKLFSGAEPPTEPFPAHRAQAVVYAYMAASVYGAESLVICVCYTDKKGGVIARFPETLSAEDCEAEFMPLFCRYQAWHQTLRSHRNERDAGLHALRFPYGAFRPGQREMAVQVFTAISRRKRILCEMPTGTGKSAAAIFPALMALGQHLTGQVFYLTARNTQRMAAQECLGLFRARNLSLWTLTLNARDTVCMMGGGCDTEVCPYAIGYYIRLDGALNELLPLEDWNGEVLKRTALLHQVCPFELSLELARIADMVICDYNYAFDPIVRIRRVFDERRDLTLLIDESHNLISRVRDMLSSVLDIAALRELRKMYKKRNLPVYIRLTAVIKGLLALKDKGAISLADTDFPALLPELYDALLDEISKGHAVEAHFEILMAVKLFLSALEGQTHTYILEGGVRDRRLTAFCLSVSEHIGDVTEGTCGAVFFSATLSPLDDMKVLLGAGEDDAAFRTHSPFPAERLFVKRLRVNTRYTARDATAEQVAAAIHALFTAKGEKYMAFFPSFAYLSRVAEHLADLPLAVQTRNMDEKARNDFLNRFRENPDPVLGLCVMGGVFSEGIDLPGNKLSGAALVGVGLPQVNVFQETLRDYYEQRFSKGFRYAYQIPGMQKILQAAGRVIRSETDKGVVLLIDDRYYQKTYEQLCPPHWIFNEGDLKKELALFWQAP